MKTAGIYKIQRIGTEQCYVGSSSDLRKRKTSHMRQLRKGEHHAKWLQHAWSKHGPDAFEFSIIELCEGEDLRTILMVREQHWMDLLTPCFNTVLAAGSTLGFKMPRELVERHRQQITGRKLSPEHAAIVRTLACGLKRSDETKEKLRQHGIERGIPRSAIENSANARRGKPLSEGHIEQMRARMTGRKHSEQELAAMRASNTPEVRAKKGAASRGKKQSPEQIAKRMESSKRTKEANRQKITREVACA